MRGLYRFLSLCFFVSILVSCGGEDSNDNASQSNIITDNDSGTQEFIEDDSDTNNDDQKTVVINSPLPENIDITIVSPQIDVTITEGAMIDPPFDTIEPYFVTDSANNLIYMAFYTPNSNNLILGGESTASVLISQFLSVIPLSALEEERILDAISNHQSLPYIVQRVEEIVASIGYLDIDLLSEQDINIIIQIAQDVMSVLENDASIPSLQQKLSTVFDITQPGYEDLVEIDDISFDRSEAGQNILNTLTLRNYTYLYYDTRLLRGTSEIPVVIPMLDAADTANTLSLAINVLKGFIDDTPSKWTGSSPKMTNMSFAVSNNPDEVITLELDPRNSKALFFNVVMTSLNAMKLNISGRLLAEINDGSMLVIVWLETEIDQYVSENEEAFRLALSQTTSSAIVDALEPLVKDFLNSDRLRRIAQKASLSFQQYSMLKKLLNTAFKFLDVGSGYGIGQQITQLITYPAHSFSIKPATTNVNVQVTSSTSAEITWSNTFGYAPDQYSVRLINRDRTLNSNTTVIEQEFLLNGGVTSLSLNNLEPFTDYWVEVLAVDNSYDYELYADGINVVDFTTEHNADGYILKRMHGNEVTQDNIQPMQTVNLYNTVRYQFGLYYNNELVGYKTLTGVPSMSADYRLPYNFQDDDYVTEISLEFYDSVRDRTVVFPLILNVSNEFYRRINNAAFRVTIPDPNEPSNNLLDGVVSMIGINSYTTDIGGSYITILPPSEFSAQGTYAYGRSGHCLTEMYQQPVPIVGAFSFSWSEDLYQTVWRNIFHMSGSYYQHVYNAIYLGENGVVCNTRTTNNYYVSDSFDIEFVN